MVNIPIPPELSDLPAEASNRLMDHLPNINIIPQSYGILTGPTFTALQAKIEAEMTLPEVCNLLLTSASANVTSLVSRGELELGCHIKSLNKTLDRTAPL